MRYKEVKIPLFGCDLNEVLDVRIKKGGNYDYEPGVVLFKVTKGDLVDIMLESGQFNINDILDPMHVWVEYSLAIDFDTDLIVDRKLKVVYSLYDGLFMGGGNWEYEGDYVQWFRNKKISKIVDSCD